MGLFLEPKSLMQHECLVFTPHIARCKKKLLEKKKEIAINQQSIP